jgi:hypothetical protein
VSLAPGQTKTGIITLRNDSDASVSSIVIRSNSSDPSVRVDINPRQIGCLATGASTSVAFTVSRTSEGTPSDMPVQFITTYLVSSSSGDPERISQTATAALEVKPASLPELVTTALEGSTTTVNDYRDGKVTLVVTNKRSDAIALDEINVSSPKSITTAVALDKSHTVEVMPDTTKNILDAPIELRPRETRTFPMGLKAGDPIEPGSRDLEVEIVAQQHVAGIAVPVTADTLTRKSVAVEIFGESGILEVLGLPVFFLIPGMILILVASFLITRASPWRNAAVTTGLTTVGKTTLVVVLGVALSLVMAKLYPQLTKLEPGTSRNYLAAYSFNDFYYVFFWSFVLALGAWVLACIAYLAVPFFRWLAIPAEEDEPLDLLRKLSCRKVWNITTVFPNVNVASQLARRVAYRRDGKLFVSPAIEITFAASPPSEAQAARDYLAEHLSQRHLRRVWLKIRAIKGSGWIEEPHWAPGMINAPKIVDKANALPTGQLGSLVSLTVDED